ncbi:hypothetical protein AXW38_07400 [Yersinia ruckeri]|uniref:hypothetical protein n=1 Tax=Yersinia ruckeri TaxID=29486 RepID=UPI0004E42E4D|nr:hypothetical protein [Yersinia ruckeri]ARZ00811.1 hypothetical protein QMA0440_01471 [Yersinia ruckeri]KFE37238.1 hypothetical protein nADLYRO1b_3406 [Yersinia ruckeri]MCW6607719.1 hypothetical protein [Yersinia ruckeri]MCW6613957.1 hypothetical protein [Yersinia ruckeri]OIX34795.1 hypothetical protein AXW19_07370 [Yersinia ruckeri]
MPAIDITTMRGEMPRAVAHLLPEQAATVARNCHFRHGVITPMMADGDGGKTFAFKPETIFRYRDNFWFAWRGQVDAIHSPIAQDKYDRVYFTDGEYPKVTSSAIATQGSGNYPAASFRLGIPAPSNPIEVTSINPPADHGEDDPTDDDTRFYVETYVTDYGEEGPPGPVSQEVSIVYPGSSVDLTLQPPGSQHSNITRRRIYRSASGGGVADYLLLVELAVGVLTYQDLSLDKELGPVLETENYLMPPDEMIGLCLMANGIAAGFAGNQVMFSEAFLPYAWPESYKQTTEHDIVAIAPIGVGLVVGTKGRPYLFSGISPSNITNIKLPLVQACVSRRSMVAMDGFALYASPNGLVSVDGSGNALVATEQIIEPRQWRKHFNPESIKAWQVEGEYLAIYQTAKGNRAGFIFDPQSMDIRHLTSVFDTAFNDLESDTLYTVKGDKLFISQSSASPLPLVWRSKLYLAPAGTSFSCLRIMSDSVQRVGVNLMVDGAPVLSLPPGSLTDGLLKLPPIVGRKWLVEVWGYAQVERITLSTSMLEMPA